MHVDRTHTCPFMDGVDVAADGLAGPTANVWVLWVS